MHCEEIMPIIRYFSSNGKWENHELNTKRTTIGRQLDQDIQLFDRMISKTHAEITLSQDGRYVLRDVGSRNGTTLNNEIITSPRYLKNGDSIGLGGYILTFMDSIDPIPDEFFIPTDPNSQAIYTGSSKSREDEGATSQIDAVAQMHLLEELQNMPSICKKISAAQFLPESKITSEADLRRDYEKLRAAAELSAQAAVTMDLDKLLELIIDKAFELFRPDRAAILLRDETGRMVTRIALDKSRRPLEHFKISETLLEVIIQEKSAILSGDALQDRRFSTSNSIIVDSIRSTMCVPLIYEDEVCGIINLDTQLTIRAFTEKDLQILTGFARQAAFMLQQAKMVKAEQTNAIIRENLSRIIPPHLINDVLNGKIQLQKSGRRTKATVLFADIRSFSNMTEINEPETIVTMLNDFFERMVECIFRHEGTLDKFVGDEVMAVWNLDANPEVSAQKAVRCALEMMQAVEDLNEAREAKRLPQFQIGIGIASGLMIAGYMGSTQAMSYTVIGDTVNLGARLCAAARPQEILINGETYDFVNQTIPTLQLPPIIVKGKREPVEIFRVLRQ